MIEALEPLVGEWRMRPEFPPPTPPVEGHARVVFEWMPGRTFLVQRWEIPIAEAPDGLAVIGYDESRGGYLQHYFDSRGVARLYEMSFDGRVWKLWREKEDFSPLSFSQRFTGTLSDDGDTIAGQWERTADDGTWELDFHLTYTRA
jgi:hypothetical protein